VVSIRERPEGASGSPRDLRERGTKGRRTRAEGSRLEDRRVFFMNVFAAIERRWRSLACKKVHM